MSSALEQGGVLNKSDLTPRTSSPSWVGGRTAPSVSRWMAVSAGGLSGRKDGDLDWVSE
jgi:hypothetical protein